MGNLQTYEPMDLSVSDELSKNMGTSGSEFHKLKPGKNVVRFLPRKKGWRSHVKVVHEHFVNDVPGREGVVRFACPRRMAKGWCPECALADKMKRSDNPIDRESARQHYPSMRIYSNIIDRRNEEAGPKLLTFGRRIWEQLETIARDPDDGGDYTCPTDDGFDVIIKRTGTGRFDTSYEVRPARSNSPLSDDGDEAAEWIDSQWSLDAHASVLPRGKLSALLGIEEDSGSGNKRALPPGRSRSSGRGRRRRTAQQDLEAGGEADDIPF
ncbi:MAG: hypothetical protein ACE5FA_05240 [Dehalococcoidia bacterium]